LLSGFVVVHCWVDLLWHIVGWISGFTHLKVVNFVWNNLSMPQCAI
jgi:hypothetical protein